MLTLNVLYVNYSNWIPALKKRIKVISILIIYNPEAVLICSMQPGFRHTNDSRPDLGWVLICIDLLHCPITLCYGKEWYLSGSSSVSSSPSYMSSKPCYFGGWREEAPCFLLLGPATHLRAAHLLHSYFSGLLLRLKTKEKDLFLVRKPGFSIKLLARHSLINRKLLE